ncbi:hypothetical protein [Mammaliicoccus sciuri]|uniref:hypothetical protein n=1 Tax=Mammaliicoccus sciuri TaxID=1296 RepID=UPI001E448509|nr:hypothetical protein [Mammaliicoccus sciuri]
MKRVASALKEGLYVLIMTIIVAIILNFRDFGVGYNKFWSFLGSFEYIKFFDEQPLNGLVVLGFLLGLVVFVLGLFFPDKGKEK